MKNVFNITLDNGKEYQVVSESNIDGIIFTLNNERVKFMIFKLCVPITENGLNVDCVTINKDKICSISFEI